MPVTLIIFFHHPSFFLIDSPFSPQPQRHLSSSSKHHPPLSHSPSATLSTLVSPSSVVVLVSLSTPSIDRGGGPPLLSRKHNDDYAWHIKADDIPSLLGDHVRRREGEPSTTT